MTDFPTSNSRRQIRKPKSYAGPVFGGIAVFVWAFAFSVSQSLTKVTGTASMPADLALGLGVGLAGGLAGALVVWLFLQFVLGRRKTSNGRVLLAALGGIAVVGAVPASGFRVIGAGMAAEQDAMAVIRQGVEERRAAARERMFAERDALVGQDFFEAVDLAEPGGLRRARDKVKALREMQARADAQDEGLRAQARTEIAAMPVSGPRRAQMLRSFEEGVAHEKAETAIGAELSAMLFDEMDSQLTILERRRWVVEYGQIAFTSTSDMNAFNIHATRVQQISAELDQRVAAREQRIRSASARY
ncbi:MAG: hypothetical protein REJ23_04225 [Brevundimonas sp.]|nr:hypothetical protein [Brevundimonas sp.]